MLVLLRKRDQKIMIGDNIVVTICEIHDGIVRIGIEAPSAVSVHRAEAHRAIHDPQSLPAPHTFKPCFLRPGCAKKKDLSDDSSNA